MPTHPILIAGQWREANASTTFRAESPPTAEPLPDEYPVSTWADCDAALSAAADAATALRGVKPDQIASFLNGFARRIEAHSAQIVEMANLETALPLSPRLADVELPRTTGQLRQAAEAALEGSWSMPTIDSKLNIRSYFASIGPICIFGPNNFPLAFNGISGGDFAAAIAAGNPVIVKGHPSHPGTTRQLAEKALAALQESQLPPATVQLLYHMQPELGLRLVADPRIGATAFTGSRAGGLKLKAAADAAGKPIYLELSSINPVVILPGALAERADKIIDEFVGSCLLGNGQFCTNSGLSILLAGDATERFIKAVKGKFEAATPGLLFSAGVRNALSTAVENLRAAGAEVLTGGAVIDGKGHRFANTLLRVSGARFLQRSDALQTEAFGNASLIVVAANLNELQSVLDSLEGNLTGCVYSATTGADDEQYNPIAARLRPKVGRFINDKMPTGVAVSPAMNHGGPYPATGHPGFTAVGIPASLRRFAMLQCFDNVRGSRLPPALGDKNPTGKTWRLIDGQWTRADIATS